jgi:hypothetical protein
LEPPGSDQAVFTQLPGLIHLFLLLHAVMECHGTAGVTNTNTAAVADDALDRATAALSDAYHLAATDPDPGVRALLLIQADVLRACVEQRLRREVGKRKLSEVDLRQATERLDEETAKRRRLQTQLDSQNVDLEDLRAQLAAERQRHEEERQRHEEERQRLEAELASSREAAQTLFEEYRGLLADNGAESRLLAAWNTEQQLRLQLGQAEQHFQNENTRLRMERNHYRERSEHLARQLADSMRESDKSGLKFRRRVMTAAQQAHGKQRIAECPELVQIIKEAADENREHQRRLEKAFVGMKVGSNGQVFYNDLNEWGSGAPELNLHPRDTDKEFTDNEEDF